MSFFVNSINARQFASITGKRPASLFDKPIKAHTDFFEVKSRSFEPQSNRRIKASLIPLGIEAMPVFTQKEPLRITIPKPTKTPKGSIVLGKTRSPPSYKATPDTSGSQLSDNALNETRRSLRKTPERVPKVFPGSSQSLKEQLIEQKKRLTTPVSPISLFAPPVSPVSPVKIKLTKTGKNGYVVR